MKSRICKFITTSVASTVLVVGQVGFVSSTAQAASTGGCSCQTVASGAEQIGTISSVSGDVMVSGDTGFVSAKTGQSLSANGQVITGVDGKLAGVVGGCSFNVGANSTMTMEQTGSKICLKTSNVEITPVAAGGGVLPIVPIVVGTAVIGGVITGVVLTSKDKKKSASN